METTLVGGVKPESPRIPIQNLYYLLCYAWDQLKQGELIDVTKVPTTQLVDLFAFVLCEGVKHLARRGLEQGYDVREEDLCGVRGRVLINNSIRRHLFQLGRSACRYDEISSNTLANQIVKTTLRALLNCPALDTKLRKETRSILRGLQEIATIRIESQCFRKVQIHSNNRFYRFLLNVCELIHEAWLVDPLAGVTRFRDFERHEGRMARVFQRFLLNFLRVNGASVASQNIEWEADSITDASLSLLPRMTTDISLKTPGQLTIIDAKYYQNSLNEYYDVQKVHSGNLYQLMSYLRNAKLAPGDVVSGMLIYPRVDRTLREDYTINGYTVRIRTLDLSRNWKEIEAELRDIASLH